MPIPCNCDYCQKTTYIWRLPNNTLWVEIPRNGSFTIKKEASFNPMQKVLYKDIEKYTDAFWFMRNPIHRFKSLISEFFFDGTRRQQGRTWLRDLDIPVGVSDDYIPEIVCDYFQFINKIPDCHLWDTQSSFVADEIMLLPNIKAFDISFMKKFMLLEETNKTTSPNIDLAEKCIYFLKDFYCLDFDMYNSLVGF